MSRKSPTPLDESNESSQKRLRSQYQSIDAQGFPYQTDVTMTHDNGQPNDPVAANEEDVKGSVLNSHNEVTSMPLVNDLNNESQVNTSNDASATTSESGVLNSHNEVTSMSLENKRHVLDQPFNPFFFPPISHSKFKNQCSNELLLISSQNKENEENKETEENKENKEIEEIEEIEENTNFLSNFNVEASQDEIIEPNNVFNELFSINKSIIRLINLTSNKETKIKAITNLKALISKKIENLIENDEKLAIIANLNEYYFEVNSPFINFMNEKKTEPFNPNFQKNVKDFFTNLLIIVETSKTLDDLNKPNFLDTSKISEEPSEDRFNPLKMYKTRRENNTDKPLRCAKLLFDDREDEAFYNITIIDEGKIILIQPTFPYGTTMAVLTEIQHDFKSSNFSLFRTFLLLFRETIKRYNNPLYVNNDNTKKEAATGKKKEAATGKKENVADNVNIVPLNNDSSSSSSNNNNMSYKQKFKKTKEFGSYDDAFNYFVDLQTTETNFVEYFFFTNQNITFLKYLDNTLNSVHGYDYEIHKMRSILPPGINIDIDGKLFLSCDANSGGQFIFSQLQSDSYQIDNKNVSFMNFDKGESGEVVNIEEKTLTGLANPDRERIDNPEHIFIYSFNSKPYIEITRIGNSEFKFTDITGVCGVDAQNNIVSYRIDGVSITNVVNMFNFFLNIMILNDIEFNRMKTDEVTPNKPELIKEGVTSEDGRSRGVTSSENDDTGQKYLEYLLNNTNHDNTDRIHFLICTIMAKLYGDLITYWLSLDLFMNKNANHRDIGIISSKDYGMISLILLFAVFLKSEGNTYIYDFDSQRKYNNTFRMISANHLENSEVICAISNRSKFVFKLFNIFSSSEIPRILTYIGINHGFISSIVDYNTRKSELERCQKSMMAILSSYNIQLRKLSHARMITRSTSKKISQESDNLLNVTNSFVVPTESSESLSKLTSPHQLFTSSDQENSFVFLYNYYKYNYDILLDNNISNSDIMTENDKKILNSNLQLMNVLLENLKLFNDLYKNILDIILNNNLENTILGFIAKYQVTNSYTSSIETYNFADIFIYDLFEMALRTKKDDEGIIIVFKIPENSVVLREPEPQQTSEQPDNSGGNKRKTNKRKIYKKKINTNKRRIHTNKKTTNKRRIHIRKKITSKKLESRI
jgi:hypothetical protein